MSATELSTDRPLVYDLDDFRALFALNQRGRKGLWRRIFIGLLLSSLIGLVIVVLWCGCAVVRDNPLSLVPFGFVLIMLLLLSGAAQARTMSYNAKHSGLLVEHVFAISPESFVARSAKGESRIHWTAVKDVVVFRQRLFVFIAARVAFMVPARAFTGEQEFENFAREAEQCWRAASGGAGELQSADMPA